MDNPQPSLEQRKVQRLSAFISTVRIKDSSALHKKERSRHY
nr:MAG TPA: hypothetical protein [Caudoviricetes sp.]